MRRAWVIGVVCWAIAGCDAPMGGNDGGVDGGSADAGMTGPCETDDDCDDGVFCDGVEQCDPDNTTADAQGCSASVDPVCSPDQTCDEDADVCDTDCDVNGDADGDGADAMACGGTDCDDTDANRFLGNAEVCDPADHDEDCDPTTFGFRDGDGDDSPDANCCNVGDDGNPTCGGDCNDSAAGVHPSATETCNERDDNCDGVADEGVAVQLYADADGDGFGDETGTPELGCPGFVPMRVTDHSDCDDTQSSVSPVAPDACDNTIDDNCDGVVNDGCVCMTGETRPCMALGECGSGTETCQGRVWSNCDRLPDAFERCDGRDEDCNGVIDDGLRASCYPDGDRDGYAAAGASATQECLIGGACPAGSTSRAPAGAEIDCDDTRSARSPENVEVCNALRIDEDCDGTVDEGVSVNCYADGDNDGYAAMGAGASSQCPDASRTAYGMCPVSYTDRAPTMILTTDCDDSMGSVRPTAVEQCNGVDDDCNGMIDDGTRVLCYSDTDDDSYAVVGAMSMMLCRDPARATRGYCPPMWTFRSPALAADRDCAEGDPSRYPGAIELCDAIDQDCDGSTADAIMVTCYVDSDNDTYPVTGASAMMACPVAGRESVGGCPNQRTNRVPGTGANDCADMDPSIHPGITEVCNDPADDRNCNPADEGQIMCWRDVDMDGRAAFGIAVTLRCPVGGVCPVGYTSLNPSTRPTSDCDDTMATGGLAGHTVAPVACYPDTDGDSYPPSIASPTYECPVGPAYGMCSTGRTARSTGTLDCCDSNMNVRPSQTGYFDVSYICGTSPSSFDYNCSGGATSQYTYVFAGCGGGPPGCGTNVGWVGSVPACGVTASWTYCEGMYDIDCGCVRCEGADDTNTQACH